MELTRRRRALMIFKFHTYVIRDVIEHVEAASLEQAMADHANGQILKTEFFAPQKIVETISDKKDNVLWERDG